MFIATDIGGTTGRVLAYEDLRSTEPLGKLEFTLSRNFQNADHALNHDMQSLKHCIRQLIQSHESVQGIGLAVAGKVNAGRTGLVLAGDLSHWVGFDLKEHLESEFGCGVIVGNDAEALALADAVYGLGLQSEYAHKDFIGMIWGTGVGGACVRYTPDGYLTIPMEPGHMQLSSEPDDPICGCGQRGHLEAYAGGGRIQQLVGKEAKDMSREDWRLAYQKMRVGLMNILLLQPVPLVVFSGGVACKQPWMLELLEHDLDEPKFGSPQVRLSHFGESAGSLGALSLLSL